MSLLCTSSRTGRTAHARVNNHGTQNEVPHIEDLSHEQWRHVFDVNIHSFFYLTKNLIPIMPWGGSIINNASINPFVGHPKLLDYTSTKGAIVGFTRALSNQIVKDKGIRVNAVCPGPIWTPLVAATMGKESLESFGPGTAIGRAGQPVEVATAFVFLASADSSYFTAQVSEGQGELDSADSSASTSTAVARTSGLSSWGRSATKEQEVVKPTRTVVVVHQHVSLAQLRGF